MWHNNEARRESLSYWNDIVILDTKNLSRNESAYAQSDLTFRRYDMALSALLLLRDS